jgi:hypothetical protein
LHGITEAEGIRGAAGRDAVLLDKGQDGAGNEVPVFVEVEGDDRLNIGGPLGPATRAGPNATNLGGVVAAELPPNRP